MVVEFEQLIRELQEIKLASKLMAAKTAEERVKICGQAKASKTFQEFINKFDHALAIRSDESGVGFSEFDSICTEDNAIEVALILVIGRIDDIDIFTSGGSHMFEIALENVDETMARVAAKLTKFYFEDGYPTTAYCLEEMMEIIF